MVDQKEQARENLKDAVHRALEAGMTLEEVENEVEEVEDEVEYTINNYKNES